MPWKLHTGGFRSKADPGTVVGQATRRVEMVSLVHRGTSAGARAAEKLATGTDAIGQGFRPYLVKI
jgi:hypothetical protein